MFTLTLQRLHSELPNAIIRQVADSGHLPHVDNPKLVSNLIVDFARRDRDSELVMPIKRQNACLDEIWLSSSCFPPSNDLINKEGSLI